MRRRWARESGRAHRGKDEPVVAQQAAPAEVGEQRGLPRGGREERPRHTPVRGVVEVEEAEEQHERGGGGVARGERLELVLDLGARAVCREDVGAAFFVKERLAVLALAEVAGARAAGLRGRRGALVCVANTAAWACIRQGGLFATVCTGVQTTCTRLHGQEACKALASARTGAEAGGTHQHGGHLLDGHLVRKCSNEVRAGL